MSRSSAFTCRGIHEQYGDRLDGHGFYAMHLARDVNPAVDVSTGRIIGTRFDTGIIIDSRKDAVQPSHYVIPARRTVYIALFLEIQIRKTLRWKYLTVRKQYVLGWTHRLRQGHQ